MPAAMFAQRLHRAAVFAAVLALLIMAGCSDGGASQYGDAAGGDVSMPAVTVPALSATGQAGERAFNSSCVLCHGVNAAGTNQGPPLVHRIYEPGHHQDFAFRNAVRNGVPAHHWQFGDMPALPNVSADDLERIICYVRELQRANGIFEGEPCPG